MSYRSATSMLLLVATCAEPAPPPEPATIAELGVLADGWNGEIIARLDQAYAGWDVEIGDADGDGTLDVLTGTAPDSQVLLHRRTPGDAPGPGAADTSVINGWRTTALVHQLAGTAPGLVLGVRVVDLDHDGRPEVLVGTGQDDGATAQLAILQTDGAELTSLVTYRAPANGSSYTHGLAMADLDGDGIDEIVSAYCGDGEVIRYDVEGARGPIHSRKILQLSGSGEDAWLQDVDGDGDLELVLANGFREQAAQIEIHELDPLTGDPAITPRITIDRFRGERMFYASLAIGDVDDDGAPELVVGWKANQEINRSSLVAYRIVGDRAQIAYVLAEDDPALDLGYFEKMMAFGDIDRDGRTELVVTTRGDGETEGIDSDHLGHVLAFRVLPTGDVQRDLVMDFDVDHVHSSWLALGDVDGDQRLDLVLATGKGDREEPGRSWVLRLWHED